MNSFYQAYSKPQSFSCAFSEHVSVWYDSEWPWFRTWKLDSCKVGNFEDHTFDPHLQEKLNNNRGGEPFNWVSHVSLINTGWTRVLEPDYNSNRRYNVTVTLLTLVMLSNCEWVMLQHWYMTHAIFSHAKQRSYSSNIFNSFIRKGNK